jgi:hypothetical protein
MPFLIVKDANIRSQVIKKLRFKIIFIYNVWSSLIKDPKLYLTIELVNFQEVSLHNLSIATKKHWEFFGKCHWDGIFHEDIHSI